MMMPREQVEHHQWGKVRGRCVEGAWKVRGRCVEGALEVRGRCVEGAWKLPSPRDQVEHHQPRLEGLVPFARLCSPVISCDLV